MSCFCCSRRQKSPLPDRPPPVSPNAQIMSGSVFHNGTGCDTGKYNTLLLHFHYLAIYPIPNFSDFLTYFALHPIETLVFMFMKILTTCKPVWKFHTVYLKLKQICSEIFIHISVTTFSQIIFQLQLKTLIFFMFLRILLPYINKRQTCLCIIF